jgi:hypothetical protein
VHWLNTIFESYDTILVIVLIVMVPIWIAKGLFEAMATIVHRARER